MPGDPYLIPDADKQQGADETQEPSEDQGKEQSNLAARLLFPVPLPRRSASAGASRPLRVPTDPAAKPSAAENTYLKAWQEWRAKPGPQTTAAMLETMRPLINKAVAAQSLQVNPLIYSKAKTITLSALSTYDPSKGPLISHVYNNMQALKRYAGRLAQGVSVPERVVADQQAIRQAEADLEDRLGRPPTDSEIADHLGFSMKRLRRARTAQSGVPMSVMEGSAPDTGDAEGIFDPAVQQTGVNPAWVQLVYDDLSNTDKKIMEWTLGMNGQPKLSNQEIARRLNISPGRVSQRKLEIQRKLDSEYELSPFAR